MNGHCFTTAVSNPDLTVAIHTQSHQIPFQECWSVSVIHKLPDSTLDHIRCQFETAYQLILQSCHTPHPSGTYNLSPVFSILLLKKVTVSGRKLLFCFLSTACEPHDTNHAVCGFDGFFQSVKILSMTSFGREVKLWVPCCRFTYYWYYGNNNFMDW